RFSRAATRSTCWAGLRRSASRSRRAAPSFWERRACCPSLLRSGARTSFMEPRGRSLVVETSSSRLAVRTRATGLLARLAHDLEIVAETFSGEARLDDPSWSAELTIPVWALRVGGVLRDDRVDASVLSASDRAEIE